MRTSTSCLYDSTICQTSFIQTTRIIAIAAHQRLKNTALAAALAANDSHLRQVKLEVQRHLHSAVPIRVYNSEKEDMSLCPGRSRAKQLSRLPSSNLKCTARGRKSEPCKGARLHKLIPKYRLAVRSDTAAHGQDQKTARTIRQTREWCVLQLHRRIMDL